MSIYFISENSEGHEEELRRAARAAIQRQFPQAVEDPVFALAYDQEGQVFLKGPQGIFWGRIFNHKLSLSDVYRVEQEVDRLSKNFSQGIQPCFFFPQTDASVLSSLTQLRPYPAMFEYYLLESESGKSLAVKPIQQSAGERVSSEPYSFYRNSRLTRDELAELIDLSCSLKKMDALSALPV